MENLQCPYLFPMHRLMYLFLINLLFQFFLLHHSHAPCRFSFHVGQICLQRSVQISVKVPWICCDFDLSLVDGLLVVFLRHVPLFGHALMMYFRDVYHDFLSDFSTYAASPLYLFEWIFVICQSVASVNDGLFFLYPVCYPDVRAIEISIYVFLSVLKKY